MTAKFIEMPYSAMPAALTAGRIDVAYISEPFLAVVRKDVRIIGYSHNAVAKQFLQSAWFTTPQWAKGHPDVVKRFAAAVRETALWANQKANQARSGEILAKYTKIDPATFAVTAKYVKFQAFPAAALIYTP